MRLKRIRAVGAGADVGSTPDNARVGVPIFPRPEAISPAPAREGEAALFEAAAPLRGG
jgi:hypothetical protein